MKSIEQNLTPENESHFSERREHSRAEIADRKIEIKFSSQIHFAKQYVDNISLGGLFVKTSMKAEVGEELPVQFSVPLAPADDPQVFLLVARVARVDVDGLGLEFTDLEDDARRVIELFITTVIPPGLNLTKNINAATFERFAERKETKKKVSQRRLILLQKVVAIVTLSTLNIIAGYLTLKPTATSSDHVTQNYQIQGHQFKESEVQSISNKSDKVIELTLTSGTTLTIESADEKNLPPHIQRSLSIIRSLPAMKPNPLNRTADPRRVRLRY